LAGNLVEQFFHHPWHGLRFWDLVHPAFMFMAGAALYLSYSKRTGTGITWKQNFRHVALRCLKLIIFGLALYCIWNRKLVWELYNVLTQLGVTTFLVYLIIRKSPVFQLVLSFSILVIYDVLYRIILIPGFDQPFVMGQNLGSFMDIVLMGKVNDEGWVFITFIPATALVIWGVQAGRLLMEPVSENKKILTLVIAGITGLVVGYLLDIANIIPVIKKTLTASYVLVTGGFVTLMLAFLYWMIDVKKCNNYAWILAVVGMNSIFIYLYDGTIGGGYVNPVIKIFIGGFLRMAGAGEHSQVIISALVAWIFTWYICFWLYRRKMFFKL
jgi:predicted acyltransferase